MENATKAAIMTATTLIGVMILTLIVYLFRTGAILGDTYESNRKTVEIETFNSKITPYQRTVGVHEEDGKMSIMQSNSFLDVISACNYAYNINKTNDQDPRNSLTIEIDIDGEMYSIFPDSECDLEKGEVYEGAVEGNDMATKVRLYDILDNISLSKTDYPLSTVISASNGGLIYLYNFDGELLAGTEFTDYNPDMNDSKISYIRFTMVKLDEVTDIINNNLLSNDWIERIDRMNTP